MPKVSPTVPQWICTHCFIHLVNGDCTDVMHADPDASENACGQDGTTPLSEFGDMHVTPGMLSEEHSEGNAFAHNSHEECDCETISFSWSACDGCGSNLGGERYAVTGWIKETN